MLKTRPKRFLYASLCAITLLGITGAIKANQPIAHHTITTISANVGADKMPSQQQADATVKPVQNQVKGTWHYNGHGAYTINNGQFGTASIQATNAAPYAHNAQVDNLKRATFGDAVINQTTRQYQNRNQTGNGLTNWHPVGWPANNDGQDYNRGHLLGYALVGGVKGFDASESNPQNIVTQTAWANQADGQNNTGQAYYEGLVRQAIDQKHETIHYQVRALYNGNELVPRATWIQAKSADNQVNINVVVPNTQAGLNVNGVNPNNPSQGQSQQSNNNNNQQPNQKPATPTQNKPASQPTQSKTTPTIPQTGYHSLISSFTHFISNLF